MELRKLINGYSKKRNQFLETRYQLLMMIQQLKIKEHPSINVILFPLEING
jgi:hypothetical protein